MRLRSIAYEVRAHLETPGAGLAAQRRPADQLAAVTEVLARHATRTDAVEWVEDDLAFHLLLAEATGNELHARLVLDLCELQHEQNIVTARMTDLEAPLQEHEAILQAVAHRDAEGARQAMAAHLDAILARARDATRNARPLAMRRLATRLPSCSTRRATTTARSCSPPITRRRRSSSGTV